MPVLPFDPLVCTEQGYFLCNSRRCEINFVVSERLDNRTGFCCVFGKPFQFLLFFVEFVGFVFEFGLILGYELLYIRFLRLIPVKVYPAGSQFFFYFFKLAVVTEYL